MVGLVGRLNARIDIDLVEAIADAGYSLLIVGPHHSQWEQARFAALTARSGVHYVGRVPEVQAPAYLAAADVGITPYLDSPFNRASFPLKTLDYLSAGLLAVSTDLPATRWLLDDLAASEQAAAPDQILTLAAGRAAFVQAVRHMVGAPDQPGRAGGGPADTDSARSQRCRAFAARHSWACRADALAAAIGLTADPDTTLPEQARTGRPC